MRSGVLLFVVALSAHAQAGETDEADRPNILYFYVDDMGWGSIGPNGQAARRAAGLPAVRTPNLDRLAAEGVNFTRGYGCHVCSPARSSQQTGFHQGHTFADRNDPDNAKKAIRAHDPSIGRSLSSVGYVTGYWGKWGYGGSRDREDPVIQNVQTLPTSHGYRHVLAELHHVRAHTFFQPTLWSAPASAGAVGGLELVPNSMAPWRDGSWPASPALQNHPDYPTTAYCDDSYAFAALKFVRRQAQHFNQTGTPFLGLLAVQIPHAPFGEISTLPKWNSAYADAAWFDSLAPQTQQWAAMVTRIDAHFGNILRALEDPNQDGDLSDSVADKTLVVFQSDNGGPGGRNNVELDANGGLTGTKGRIQEGGIRVPLVMRWPSRINADSRLKAGSHSRMVVDVTDLLPTFCELAGASVPLGIDGVSIAPTLSGKGQQRTREFIIHEAGNGQSIIRGHHKLVRAKKNGLKLYDLDADPAEETDIASENPQLVRKLEALLLGERVAEPRGFANTYHEWTGGDDAKTSDPDNWSDYAYSNAGITYMEDRGAPRSSWVARIHNASRNSQRAVVDQDVDVLALEIRGHLAADARQTLELGRDVNVTGRNEIRLGSHSALSINGGVVSSLRWVDVAAGARLSGHGRIEGHVYNNGLVAVTGDDGTSLRLSADYHQGSAATLQVAATDKPALVVDGVARLNGLIAVDTVSDCGSRPGATFQVLTADRIEGRFENPDDQVVSADGQRFTIQYSESVVALVAQ